jgi:hypothetical protein
LLGSAVQITSESFPELRTVVDQVRHQLDYRRRIDVYVADKSEPSVSLVSYLGTHIIIIEGGVAAELRDPSRQAQLTFLIARHIGALKARHTRLDLLVFMLAAANGLPYAKPFLMPYYRATACSGDQIGLVCCGSLEAALEATGRLLVGKELAPDLPLGGVLPQAALIRTRWLPRFAQFVSPTPHVVNRYMNLVMFGRRWHPETWDRLRGPLAPNDVRQLDKLWQASPQSRRYEHASTTDSSPVETGWVGPELPAAVEPPAAPRSAAPVAAPRSAAPEPVVVRSWSKRRVAVVGGAFSCLVALAIVGALLLAGAGCTGRGCAASATRAAEARSTSDSATEIPATLVSAAEGQRLLDEFTDALETGDSRQFAAILTGSVNLGVHGSQRVTGFRDLQAVFSRLFSGRTPPFSFAFNGVAFGADARSSFAAGNLTSDLLGTGTFKIRFQPAAPSIYAADPCAGHACISQITLTLPQETQ